MTTGYETGLRAEATAALLLLLKGYRILARRYKTPVGEIDLVARRGRTLAFIEVKRRGSEEAAAEAIHAKNRARVARASTLYLQNHPEYAALDIRFDAVVLAGSAWPRHIPRAWEGQT
jgi:putative endonuclease